MLNVIAGLVSLPLAAPVQDEPLGEWLRSSAIALDAETADAGIARALGSARVVGLGEATHGQRECFAFKRRLTMHLVRSHGFRLVAYEASATSALVLDDYVQGRTDDLDAAMGGFGMLIWMVAGNRGLLEDLRAWNEDASAGDRVEIVGIDVQDPEAAADRLHGLLEVALPDLAPEARAVAADLLAARNAAYGGETAAIGPAQDRLATFVTRLTQAWGDLAVRTSKDEADEALRCARELARFPVAPMQPALRDRGMGQSLLDALAARPAGTKAVLWGHNGHVTKGPLRWMGTDEPGCGGYVRAALGDGYYALGVAFGSGGFQSLDRDGESRWWFRRYEHGPPPTGTVERAFWDAGLEDSFLDLRAAPDAGPVRAWLDGSGGMRSWGGYAVPADPDAAVSEGRGLAWTIPSADYDGLLFLKRTTSAEPVDPDRVWQAR